ncbi:MAG: hypothetical protein GY869_07060 [Planctomycetes bacterium]|nr:hypothetical protein [Planctomycetota bacterium]
MNHIINITAVVSLAALGALLGWYSSKLRRPFWLLGYILPLLLLLAVGFARRFPTLEFVTPFRWLTYGRIEFALLGPIVTCLFASLFSRLPRHRTKILLSLLVALVVLSQSLLPFVVPLFMTKKMQNLKTTITNHGVCLQSTNYTCGPAAAVSALYQLGIEADEGQIALQAFTSPAGTSPDLLCRALNDIYADQGVTAAYRPFKSIDQLKDAGITIVVIKYSFLIDHFITILEITDDQVVAADPLVGHYTVSRNHFQQIWRQTGITIRKK